MRRNALLYLFALAGSLLAACPKAPPSAPGPTLELLARDSEIWSWTSEVRGKLVGRGKLKRCYVQVDEREHEAEIKAGLFAAAVAFGPGAHQVSARCRDGQGRLLTTASVRFQQMLDPAPLAHAQVRIEGNRLHLDGSASRRSEGTQAELTNQLWFGLDRRGLRETELGVGAQLELPLPTVSGTHRYELRVVDALGHVGRSQLAIEVAEDGSARSVLDASWVEQAVVYGVVPSLYGTPPLARVTEKLEQLQELGVNTLWLSPIFATPPDDFGYAVTDYFTVREDFGSAEDLAALVQAAHQRDLRVILDLVINHSSSEHRYFREAEQLSTRSHYYDFYARDEQGQATHYFGWQHLPNLNYNNPEVQRWALAFSARWLRGLSLGSGVDGYRVDAAWGVREREPDFYQGWSAALRRTRSDVLLLAEASARDPYYVTQGGFDAAYDWTNELGHHAWENVFREQAGIARRLSAAIEATERATPKPERTLRFLNNNDTGKRFITKHGEPLTRVATAALLTLPGIPCLYAHDEVGAEYEPYLEQAPVTRERRGLRDFHRTLIALRKSTPALHGPGYRLLAAPEGSELFAFLRTGPSAADVAVVALNFGSVPIETEIELPEEQHAALGKRLREALAGSVVPLRAGRLRLKLEPWGMKVFVPHARAAASREPRPELGLTGRAGPAPERAAASAPPW